MKKTEINGSPRRDGPRDAPISCPAHQRVTGIGIGPRPAGRPADPVDNREQVTLMRAFATANTGLSRAQTPLGELGSALLQTYQAALTAIDAVERLAVGRTAGEARRQSAAVRARHTEDGPEGLRRGRLPWAWLQWCALGVNSLFDLPFIGEATAQALSIGGDGLMDRIAHALAYLVTFGVAVLQFALGHLLGRSLFRWRVRVGRRPERVRRTPRMFWRHLWRLDDPRTETRRPDDLPWPSLFWPVLANLLLITLLAFTASSRVQQSNTSDFGVGGGLVAVFLVVSLSLATLAATVLAHNPYADSDKEARSAMTAARKKVDKLVPRARELVVEHSTSWHRLRAALERARVDAYQVVDDACALIVEQRAETALAGTVDLPLRDYAWPTTKEGESGAATPRLRLEILGQSQALLHSYAPGPLEDWLEACVGELNGQFALPDPGPADTAQRIPAP
ncbi:hypothetical protein ACH5A7_27940 [Streptomyces sp. NPDC018955]|uniref:hypothetical protein n=1 Tax=Streptomyces sp. NPDC018955 TaxID=3365055 RepID=UPI003797CFED